MTLVYVPEAFLPLYEGRSSHYAFYGGRGTGKSHSVAEGLLFHSRRRKQRFICGRQFQNSTDESSKQLFELKISTLGLDQEFDIQKKVIYHKNGSEFHFIGLDRNPESKKSFEGADWFWGEEAQTINEVSLDIVIPTFLRKPGSRMVWTWNPRFRTDPVDALFRSPTPPRNSYVRHVTHKDNPHFYRTELYHQYEHAKQTSKRRFEHIWLGGYDENSEARIFSNVRVGRYQIPETAKPLFGMDFGFSRDPNAIIKCYYIKKEKILYISEEKFGKVPLTDLPSLLDCVTESRKFEIVADSSRPETIDFLSSHGFAIYPSIKGPGSIKNGINFLQGLTIIISPDCPNMIEESQRYFWKVDRNGQILPIPDDSYNHGWDAVRYAVETEVNNIEDEGDDTGFFKLKIRR